MVLQVFATLDHPTVVTFCNCKFIILRNVRLPSLHEGVVSVQLMIPLVHFVIPIIDYLNILAAFFRLKCQMDLLSQPDNMGQSFGCFLPDQVRLLGT